MTKDKIRENKKMTLRGYYENLPSATYPKSDFIRKVTSVCGCTEAAVRSWLRGSSKPAKEREKKLSNLTGIPEENLWGE